MMFVPMERTRSHYSRAVRFARGVSLSLLLGVVGAVPLAAQRTVASERGSSATAAAEQLLTRPVTITLDRVPVWRAIDELSSAAGVTVIYRRSVAESVTELVTLRATKMPLGEALNRVLSGTSLQVVLLPGGQISIAPTGVAQDTTGSIGGQVVDSAARRGVTGAVVTVQGTKMSVATNTAGHFTLPKVPAGTFVLSVKALGYALANQSVTVTPGQRTSVSMVLRQTTHMLSGVVTTATGVRQKLEVGNSSVVLNVDSIMQTAPIMTVTDLIDGRVPGVTVQRTSGTPGDPARIRMRGTSSVNQSNDPIIVVDGIRIYSQQSDARNTNVSTSGRSYASPSALDMIDPNSIERIEFLRGASAASMYGSDAASGVIVITTKRGQAGPPRTDVIVNGGTSAMLGKWPEVTYKFGTPLMGGAPIWCLSFCGNVTIDSVVRFQALNDPRLTVLGRGSNYGTSTTISGGSQQMSYAFTGSTNNQLGILKLPAIEQERYLRFQGEPAPDWMRRPDRYQTDGINATATIRLSPSIELTANTQLSNAVQRRTSMSQSINSATSILQSTFVDLSQLTERPLLGNPYERVVTDNTQLRNNLSVQFRKWPRVPLLVQVGNSGLTENVEMSIARGLTVDADSAGSFRGRTKTATNSTVRAVTTIPTHRLLTLGFGLDLVRSQTHDQDGSFRGIAEGITDPSTGVEAAATKFSKQSSDSRSFGWWIEPRFNIASRFFVAPSFRLDNNGLSGKNARLIGLPRMDMSWLASDESFFPWKNIITLFRPRVAFGVAGVAPNPGDGLRLYTQNKLNPFGGTEPLYGTLLTLDKLGNTRLRPERRRELETGFDLEVFGGRAILNFTRSLKHNKDAIVANNFAMSVFGGGTIQMNIGDIQNTGTEMDLSAILLRRDAIDVSVTSSFSRYRSKVLRLNNDAANIQFNASHGNVRYVVGYPVEGLWELPILGYDDVDGNGWIASNEVVFGTDERYLGSGEKKYTANVSPTVSLFGRRVSLTSMFIYESGQMQSLSGATNSARLRDGGLSPVFGNIIQGPDGFDRQIAVLGSLVGFGNRVVSTGMMQKVNVLRLKSAGVRFNLGIRGARMLRARSAFLDLQGSELGLWTNYIGVDPNVNGILGGRGVRDTGGIPMPRTWQLKLNLGY